MVKVSIVVPVYNVEPYVERCITSLKRQTLHEIEIIVVNDCTPDKSMDIVWKLQNDDDRIKIFEHENNLGLMRARQTGYKAAIGDFITFCDSDDYLPENAIEILYNEAIKTDADIVSGNMLYIKSNGTSVTWSSTLNYGQDRHATIKSLLLHELRHNLCSKLFKASLLHNYDYQTYDHFTNGEDACLFYQVVNNMCSICQIDKIVYNYCQNLTSSSQRRYDDKAIKSICIVNKTRNNIVSQFPELKLELRKYISNIVCDLYAAGYDNDTKLTLYLNECGLEHYTSIKNLIIYSSFCNVIKFFIKRYIIPNKR